MKITLNFAYSPDTDGYCKFPPRFDSVDVTNVHDGHQPYANAIACACVHVAKELIKQAPKEHFDVEKA